MDAPLIDARGLACPEPVVRARKALLETTGDRVGVLVDDPVSVENVDRMARNLGWRVELQPSGRATQMVLTRGAGAGAASVAPAAQAGAQAEAPGALPAIAVLITSDQLGTGDERLGRLLMRAFLKTLKELDALPRQVIFMNSGVRLSTEGSDLLDDLRALESRGVEIMSCGTCLDYYGLLDVLRVGRKSNMFEIAAALLAAERVVRP